MTEPANPQLTQMLQQQLRDIHLPEPVSWWPLAPGWWVLMVLGILILILLFVWLRRYLRNQRYRKLLREEHEAILSRWKTHQETTRYCQDVNVLLKRCIRKVSSPEINEAALSQSGAAWLDAIEAISKPLSDPTRQALAEGAYQPEQRLAAIVNVPDMQKEIAEWLQNHQRGGKND